MRHSACPCRVWSIARACGAAPGTWITLVVCGAGTGRALARVPRVASRIGAWQEVPRLAAAGVTTVVSGFHPLWRTVSAEDLAWIDVCARQALIVAGACGRCESEADTGMQATEAVHRSLCGSGVPRWICLWQ